MWQCLDGGGFAKFTTCWASKTGKSRWSLLSLLLHFALAPLGSTHFQPKHDKGESQMLYTPFAEEKWIVEWLDWQLPDAGAEHSALLEPHSP